MFSTLLLVQALTVAQAEHSDNSASLEVTITDDSGTANCTLKESGAPSAAETRPVTVKSPESLQATKVRVAGGEGRRVDKGTAVLVRTAGGTQKAELEVYVLTGGATGSWIRCGEVQPFTANGGAGQTPADDEFDGNASDWWILNGEDETDRMNDRITKAHWRGDSNKHKQLHKWRKRRIHVLAHLPSGSPASPFPMSVSEGELVQIAIIQPKGGAHAAIPRVNVNNCKEVLTFRHRLVDDDADSEKQGARGDGGDDGFTLRPIGPIMRCGAGTIEYELIRDASPGAKSNQSATRPPESNAAAPVGAGAGAGAGGSAVGGGEAAVKPTSGEAAGSAKPTTAPTEGALFSNRLRVRPVYHLAAVAIVGFDAARLPRYSLSASDGDMRTILGSQEYGGLSVTLGGLWSIGGVDYEKMRWYNYFANLFVGVDVKAPLDGVKTGLALTPTGGVSLALGLSLQKTAQLQNGYAVGDTFSGDGALPIANDWDKPGVGFFVGLAIDHHIYKALLARFASK